MQFLFSLTRLPISPAHIRANMNRLSDSGIMSQLEVCLQWRDRCGFSPHSLICIPTQNTNSIRNRIVKQLLLHNNCYKTKSPSSRMGFWIRRKIKLKIFIKRQCPIPRGHPLFKFRYRQVSWLSAKQIC